MSQQRAIGIFDSGVGGLSITRVIRRELPAENIIYTADLQFSPYGTQSKSVIQTRSKTIAQFLSERECKAMVVACNTATVNSIDILRDRFDIPIVGVEPGIKPAAEQSKTGVIAVLATQQTLNSASFQTLKKRFSQQVKIECQACPRLVELVETGNIDGEQCIDVVNGYIQPLLAKGADQIVLGCTHYSFLIPVIERILAGAATIVDTANPVALELKNRLVKLNLQSADYQIGETQFFSTKNSADLSAKVSHLMGCNADVLQA